MFASRAGLLRASLALALAPLMAGSAPGDERGAAREVLARLDGRLGAIRTMTGRFVQTFTSAGLGVPQSESGTFSLSRPDRMRWEYTSPERKTAVSDGTSTWLYMPGDAVVYRGSVAAWKKEGALAVLAGGALADDYEAVSVDAARAARRGDVVLELAPKVSREAYASLLVEVEPRDLRLVSVTAIDGAGNRMSALFSDLKENAPLDAALFTFAPPAGVRVVDQDAGPARP